MTQGQELNFHFARLTSGAPGEVLAQLGKALLAVDSQRRGEDLDSPAALRAAWLALTRWLISNAANGLNAEQQLFLLSGAVGDTVTVKNPQNERVSIQLLPNEDYQALLAGLEWKHLDYLLTPLKRIAAISSGKLPPLDLDKPGRYSGPGKSLIDHVDARQLAESLRQQLEQLRKEQENLATATRAFLGLIQADRLGPTLKPAQQLAELVSQVLQQPGDSAKLAKLNIPTDESRAAVKLRQDTDRALASLAAAESRLLQALKQVRATAAIAHRAGAGDDEALAPEDAIILTPETTKLVEKDYASVNNVMVQTLTNSPHRTAWSASRVLLSENTEKFEDPMRDCYATPGNLTKSIAKINELHPNCFPHNAAGESLLPPIVIEPGSGEVQWFDDRFVISFVCTEPARRGSKLSLSPVDLAVLRMYGQFMARGDIYDYRGDRISGNFAADYAGEVKSKAKVKFAGAEKKMTFVSSSEIKDAAGRDEAVEDYMDFLFSVFNGLTIPKRITARRIGVILKYCIIGGVEQTAILALRHVTSHDVQVVREILITLAEKNKVRIVELIAHAVKADTQLGSRYRNDVEHALQEVMGIEFAKDAIKAGLTGKAPAESIAVEDADTADKEKPAGHDYFDV